jgi:hypothetical protein
MRNKNLKANRDAKLIRRFKELYDIKRVRLDDCLSKLSEEFDIMPDTARRIVFKK